MFDVKGIIVEDCWDALEIILVHDWYQKNRNWMFVCPSKPWGLKEPPRPLAFAARLWKKTRHWFGRGCRIGVMIGGMKLKKQRECHGGGFKYVLFLARKLGKMNPIWRIYFSKGFWNHQLVMVLVQKHSKASTSHITWWDFYKWMRFKTPPWISADYHKISCGCVCFS